MYKWCVADAPYALAFEKAVKLAPSDGYFWFRKRLCNKNLEKFEAAIDCFNEVIKIDPKHIDAWVMKGLCFQNLNMYIESLNCFEIVLEIQLENADAWLFKGVSASLIGNTKLAIESLNNSIKCGLVSDPELLADLQLQIETLDKTKNE